MTSVKDPTKETCTNCGGIGRVPNHPHILARTCPRCKGTGKVLKEVHYNKGDAS